jgi:hypothetical protein
VSEVGSGLNGHRPKLTKLLADMTVGAIVVEHRERLMRFGFEYVEAARALATRSQFLANPATIFFEEKRHRKIMGHSVGQADRQFAQYHAGDGWQI